jgi:phage gp29-like protein
MARLPTAEIAGVDRDPYVANWQTTLDPSDETLKTRAGGKGLSLYDEIRRDPHAFSVLQKRSLEVVSREWQVDPASDRLRDRRAAELVEAQLKALDLDRLTRGLMGAVLKGFSVGEIIWRNEAGIWTAAAVKVRRQRRFRFTVGGELRLIVRNGGSSGSFDGEAVPDRKFVVHRHSIDDDDDDPYGVGLGSVLFWPAWFKRQVLAHWLQASEIHAEPTIRAAYQGAYDEARQRQLLDALVAARRTRGLVVPDSVTIELLEAARGGGGEGFEALSRYLDELMSEAVLGETLSTNSGERGARSLGDVHNSVRLAIAKADSDLICQTLNRTLVRWIVEVNMPGAAAPRVWRDFSEPEDLQGRATRDRTLHDMGYRPADPEGYMAETYGGDWVVREPRPLTTPMTNAADGDAVSLDASAGTRLARQADDRLGALFADPPAAPADPLDPLKERLMDAAAPILRGWVEAVREQVLLASSYEDLAQRLLALSGDRLDPADLGAIMQQALAVAHLGGAAVIADQVAAARAGSGSGGA